MQLLLLILIFIISPITAIYILAGCYVLGLIIGLKHPSLLRMRIRHQHRAT